MAQEKNKTLVLGASDNPSRYSYLAMKRLQDKGYAVTGIGKKNGSVNGVEISKEKQPLEDIDTVTLYLNPQRQKEYYDYIIGLKPRRIIFNPGAENPELEALARNNNIQPLEACTLVLLSTGQF